MMPPPQPGVDAGLTLEEVVRSLERRGYDAQMRTQRDGLVRCLACGQARPATAFVMEQGVRVEGQSDPDDMALVAGIQCPCGARGTEVFHFGSGGGGDPMELEAIRQMRDGRPSAAA